MSIRSHLPFFWTTACIVLLSGLAFAYATPQQALHDREYSSSGFIDPSPASDTGNWTSKYIYLSNYGDSVATIRRNGKFGLIAKSGWHLAAPVRDISFFSGGKVTGLVGTIEISQGGDLHTSLCNGGFRGSYVICNRNGEIIVSAILTNSLVVPKNDSNYIYFVTHNENDPSRSCKECGECFGAMGVMDYSGKIIVPPGNYSMIWAYSEGLALVRDNSWRHGFVDATGTLVISCIYETAGCFSEGLTTVVQNRKIGYINRKGELVIPFLFDGAHPFKNNKALVIQGQSKFYINTKGERL